MNMPEDRDEYALVADVEAYAAREDAFFGGTRLALHEVGFALFHTERESRQGVGDKVDEQNVDRAEDGEAHDGRNEDRNDFT